MSRGHLIYGLCLPLALILGYLLADPLDSSSLAILVMVLSLLITPLLMKWYHPVLVLCWNSTFYFPYLPGQPPGWMGLVALGFAFMLLNRCVDPRRRLIVGGSVAWSLIALAVVALITAFVTGGIGLRELGSKTYGGRKYLDLGAAIIGYFVMTSQRVPKNRAGLYMALFFLSGLTAAVADLAYMARIPGIYFLISPATVTVDSQVTSSVLRVTGLSNIATAICLFLLARFGISGVLDLTKPWRLITSLGFLVAGLFSGFRSYFAYVVLTYAVSFFLEGLHRTKYLLSVVLVGALCLTGVAAFSTRLPLSVQRALSFLPIEITPAANESARSSIEWRLEMWRSVLKEVPPHLFKGKGYVIDPKDLYFVHANSAAGFEIAAEWAIVSGDYHNGPLSVLVPFGIWGTLAFGWFLCASLRALYRYCREGDPALKTFNQVIFACFVCRLIFFVFLVGGLTSDLTYFVSLVGLAISLNGELPKKSVVVEPDVQSVPQGAF